MNGTVTYPVRFCEAAAPTIAICENRTSGHLSLDRQTWIAIIVVVLIRRRGSSVALANDSLLRLIFIKIYLNKDLISDLRARFANTPESYETLEINGSCSLRRGAHRLISPLLLNTLRNHRINAHAHHCRINITERRTFGPRSQCGSDSFRGKYYTVKKKKKIDTIQCTLQ